MEHKFRSSLKYCYGSEPPPVLEEGTEDVNDDNEEASPHVITKPKLGLRMDKHQQNSIIYALEEDAQSINTIKFASEITTSHASTHRFLWYGFMSSSLLVIGTLFLVYHTGIWFSNFLPPL